MEALYSLNSSPVVSLNSECKARLTLRPTQSLISCRRQPTQDPHERADARTLLNFVHSEALNLKRSYRSTHSGIVSATPELRSLNVKSKASNRPVGERRRKGGISCIHLTNMTNPKGFSVPSRGYPAQVMIVISNQNTLHSTVYRFLGHFGNAGYGFRLAVHGLGLYGNRA